MCGRYVTPSQSEIERFWHIGRQNLPNPFERRFNVSPSAMVPMILRNDDGEFELTLARWGLIPGWWKDAKPPRSSFNARSEEAAGKPMWRFPASKARCLVPAIGWYEWKTVERIDPHTGEVRAVKQPYFIGLRDYQPFAFAALMSRFTPPGGAPEWTCSILTRDAQDAAKEIHERMPVALPHDAEADWLDPALTAGADAIALARERSIRDVIHYPVSPRVNNARSEGKELIEPVEA